MQRRLETIANNVANASTTGFRAEEIRFEAILSQAGADNTAFVRTGNTYLSRAPGGLTATGNPLDIAVEGNAWLSIQTRAGPAYTRDGRTRISENGELQSVTGAPFLDASGTPIVVDPAGGPVTISREGRLSQHNREVGGLGLFTIPETANLQRYENSGVIPDAPAEPVVEFSRTGVAQGYLENSNVNPVKEITRMIEVQRSFDAMSTTLATVEAAFDGGIRDLGSTK